MKKILIAVAFVLALFFLTATPSSARSKFYFSFGFFPPPVIVASPPAYFPPPVYYGPPPVYHSYPYPEHRVWIPGYWDWRRTPHGWRRIWIPGHWDYR